MQIRADQINKFDAAAETMFRKQVAAYLRERHGQELVRFPGSQSSVSALAADRLDQLVESALARGRGRGLVWRSSLNAFASLMVTVAPNFDQQPGIRRALDDASGNRPPDVRMNELSQHVTKQDWSAAAAAYDPNGWGIGHG